MNMGVRPGGYWFINCDIDGTGKRWRLARRKGSTMDFVTEDFQEDVELFSDEGCTCVGPFTTEELRRGVMDFD